MRKFYFLDQIQKQCLFHGDICEVGVHMGKSLVLLKLLSNPRETIYGFDLFTDDYLPKTRANLEECCESTDNVKLITGNSSDYTVAELKEIIAAPLRLLHIDAGHEYHEVLHDMLIFSPFVSDTGIIIMDDYQNREFPGIETAVTEFTAISSPRKFVPFMIGHNKIYLCNTSLAMHYQQILVKTKHFFNEIRIVRIKDYNVLIPHSIMPLERDFVIEQVIHNDFPFEYNFDIDKLKNAAGKYAQMILQTHMTNKPDKK